MSLLMDALKKAEMAKRQGSSESGREPFSLTDENRAAPLDSLSLEPLAFPLESAPKPPSEQTRTAAESSRSETPAAPPLSTPAATDPLAVALTAEQFFPTTPDSSTRPAAAPAIVQAPAVSADQRNAKNLFQAKHAASTTTPAKAKPVFAIAVGSVTLLAVVAIGGYLWWQLQPRSNLGPAVSGVSALRTPPPGPMPIAAPMPAPPTAPAPSIAATAAVGTSPALPTAADNATGEAPQASATVKAAPPARAARIARAAPEPDDERLIRVTRTPTRVAPGLTQAFDAAQRGDWASAQQAYAAALAADPHNADALHGLATIALREGRPADAERYLQRLLLANPQDAAASAALANLYARSQPAQAESKLKALALEQPELAAASIALGNLYSSQARWSEAQQAYFTAYASQPDNPDLLFNLAISLEYLNQPKLALQYYKEALQASKRWPATFSATQVDERLRALQQ